MKGIGGILAALLVAAHTAPARAAAIETYLTLEVVEVAPGLEGIAVGDRFFVALVINDQAVDVEPFVGAGHFPDLVTAFWISRDPANAGTWDPGTGVYSMAESNFVTNAFGDGITLQIDGSYPDAGAPFHDFDLAFWWQPGIEDSGAGDTFAEQLGVAEGTVHLPSVPMFGSIRFGGGDMDFLEAVLSVSAPEPAGAPAAGLALAALAARAGARRRAAARAVRP